MASRNRLEEIKGDLKCSICKELFNDPRILSCGHTFCLECIRKAYETSILSYRQCPLCKETYIVYNNNVRNLRKNFTVNNIIDTVRTTNLRCAVCQGGEETLICLKCKLSLCRHCSRRDTIRCNHQTLRRDELDSRPFLRDVIQRSKSKQTCPSHPDNDVGFFCHTCNRVMCTTCQLLDHPHHVTTELKDAVRKLRAKNIPRLLAKKARAFDISTQCLTRGICACQTVDQTDIRRYHSYRRDCTELQRDMLHLFQFGSDKTIMDVFYEHKNRIDEILDAKTYTGCCHLLGMVYTVIMFQIAIACLVLFTLFSAIFDLMTLVHDLNAFRLDHELFTMTEITNIFLLIIKLLIILQFLSKLLISKSKRRTTYGRILHILCRTKIWHSSSHECE